MKVPSSHPSKYSRPKLLFLLSCVTILCIHWVTVVYVHSSTTGYAEDTEGNYVQSESLPEKGRGSEGDVTIWQMEQKPKTADEALAKSPEKNVSISVFSSHMSSHEDLKPEVQADVKQEEANEATVFYDRYWDEPYTKIEA